MNKLIEDNQIVEIAYGTNFAYVLNDESMFLPTEYKVLHGQSNSGFLKCLKMYFNGKVQLFYLAGSYVSLQSILHRLNADSFITIVSNLFNTIINAKSNGFLSCTNIDISFDHIYVDATTLKVKLVYLPLSQRLYYDLSSFENELRVSLIKLIADNSQLLSPKTKNLSTELRNGSVSLESVFAGINGGKIPDYSSEDSMNQYDSAVNNSPLKLVALDSGMRWEVEISKSEFVIGKKESAVDGVISFNKMISRVHCKIVSRNHTYYIEDLQSANGTYVNNVRLKSNVPAPIKRGDVIRLANSSFQIV